jgi:hypothetical protein
LKKIWSTGSQNWKSLGVSISDKEVEAYENRVMGQEKSIGCPFSFKGIVSRDFRPLVFFIKHWAPDSRVKGLLITWYYEYLLTDTQNLGS